LEYFIFALIDFLSFSPITCAEYPDYIVSVGKTDRQDAFPDLTKAEVPRFRRTVGAIFSKDPARVGESNLRVGERHPVLVQVLAVFA